MSIQVFPEGCDRGTVSYLERERVPKNMGCSFSSEENHNWGE